MSSNKENTKNRSFSPNAQSTLGRPKVDPKRRSSLGNTSSSSPPNPGDLFRHTKDDDGSTEQNSSIKPPTVQDTYGKESQKGKSEKKKRTEVKLGYGADEPRNKLLNPIYVNIKDICPANEEPTNFKMIGDLLGGFLDYDKPLFSKGIVRIFIWHDLSKPILLKRVLMFDPRVEPMLTFAYKHLVGHCKFCGLITHVGHAMSSSPMASNKSILVHLPGFGSFAFVPGSSFAFSSQIPRGLARYISISACGSLSSSCNATACGDYSKYGGEITSRSEERGGGLG
ncbi:hypothetical protein M0R45_015607 [Rubus argutus]|uniref:Zinc knuckle CX2CX4HX4C domain-containing protein n=1 Tax=Rubus argutus TaxID=59490 RepID=A0AAW1XSJ8_RUBAR